MIEVNSAFKHGRYGKDWLKSLRVISNVKVFGTQDSRPADRTDEQDSLHRSIRYSYGSEKKELHFNITELTDEGIKCVK